MNNRVYKEFTDFVLSGPELLCMERALYSLLDLYKDDRINNNGSRFSLNYDEIIDGCFTKLRLHENYLKNSNFFVIAIPKHDPDPILEMLGDDVSKVQESADRRAMKDAEKLKAKKAKKAKKATSATTA